ncbi:MAG: curli assembly protein CsgF [Gammaproteobacteria bacterium]|nr:curli assembly protein CsgF [Gammaproteobacteria bacterium]
MYTQGFALLLALLAHGAQATELVYEPINPSFGGNPLIGSFLLNNAQLQDDLKDPDAVDPRASQSDLERFNDLLQRSILNRIASSLSSSLFDANGELVPGTLETSDFIIDIIDLGGGVLQVTTTDKTTGATSSFQISTAM